MMIDGIIAQCVSCEHWESKDQLEGVCMGEIINGMVGVYRLITHRTTVCGTFEPSEDAVQSFSDEEHHHREMVAAAGIDYPASLRG